MMKILIWKLALILKVDWILISLKIDQRKVYNIILVKSILNYETYNIVFIIHAFNGRKKSALIISVLKFKKINLY